MPVFEKVRGLIAKQLNISEDKIKMESEIIKDLGADSLDVVEMLMGLEEEFSITVEEEAAMNLKKVSDIVELIEKESK